MCGVTKRKDCIEIYLNSLHRRPSVLCFSEHFLNASSIDVFSLSDYITIAHSVRKNKVRGGTMIMAREDEVHLFESVQLISKFNKVDIFELSGARHCPSNVNIFCCYRTPYSNNFTEFMFKLEYLLKRFFNKKTIICGDFNVNLLKNYQERNDFLELLRIYDFRTLISDVTFRRGDAKSCLDNFITNITEERIGNCEVDENRLADGHAGIFCTLNEIPRNKSATCLTKESRHYNTVNNNNFRKLICKEDWKTLGLNAFLARVQIVFDLSFPRKTKKVLLPERSSELKWISKGIKTSSKMKRFLNTIDAKQNDETIVSFRSKYLTIYRRVVNLAKKQAVNHALLKAGNSSKVIWQIVNKHRNKRSTKMVKDVVLRCDNRIVSQPQQVADVFADTFKGDCSRTGCKMEALEILAKSTDKLKTRVLFKPTTIKEIKDIVRQMKPKRSCGHDDMPIFVIKNNIDILCDILTYFCNKCMSEGIFPEQLSLAKVTPLLKKGSQTNPKNYRLISLLPLCQK